MARIRCLKPDFFFDEDLAELPYEARLAFQGLWLMADREGRLEDSPKKIKAMIFPYDKVDVDELLALLSQKPFIVRYALDNKRYIQIINFKKHQQVHHAEPVSKIPAPSGEALNGRELVETSLNQFKPEGREGKGRERKGKEGAVNPVVDPLIEIATVSVKSSFLQTKKAIYPMIDVEGEIRKCVDWHRTHNPRNPNWERAISNWIRKAYDFKKVIDLGGGKNGTEQSIYREFKG